MMTAIPDRISRQYEKMKFIDYFFGHHGINTLVRDLYSSHSGFPAYRASCRGTPETKRRRSVIVIQPIIPKILIGREIKEIPSQNILSPK
jgi:hypothetical protein